MAQLQGFPSCCGAQILTGLYPPESRMEEQYWASTMPAEAEFHYFTVAITNPSQHNDKGVVKSLESRGFEQVLEFTGNGSSKPNLHLWARGRNWKPLAGAKGNMKQEQTVEDFELAVEKEVVKRVKKISLQVASKLKIPRQPAEKKSQTRRSTHGRGSSSSRSRTETSA